MNFLEELFSLNDKISIVTGAARGNGLAISQGLLKSGSTVILVDILKDELEESVKKLQDKGLNAQEFTCDLTNFDEILSLKKFILDNFGKINILVNNAGVTFPCNIFEYSDELWEQTYKVNLKAPFLLCREFGKIMKEQKSGVIINITSINSELAFPDNPAYVAFKGGLKQLTKSLALDFGKFGIRVNNVGPGYFHTKMTEKSWKDPILNKQRSDRTVLGRWGEPEDLIGLIIFLASDSSSYITGQDIYVDGGWSIKGL